MGDWTQDRLLQSLIDEKKEIDTKLYGLEAFLADINSGAIFHVSDTEKSMLNQQYVLMGLLSGVLGKRIEYREGE